MPSPPTARESCDCSILGEPHRGCFGKPGRIDIAKVAIELICHLTEIQGFDDYTFHHSVKTTILALVLGIASGYSEQKLIELGMGALMHDIGKIKIAEVILYKKTPLTDAEFAEITQHTTYGFDILRKNNDLSLLSAHVAFQHHEKWDGSGYPRGLIRKRNS